MSGPLLRDERGFVISRYPDPTVRCQFHDVRKPQVADRERMRLLKAERELIALWVIAENLELSDIAMTRISDALEAIRLALQVKRRQFGMQTDAQVAA
jgi:hypothetical protein